MSYRVKVTSPDLEDGKKSNYGVWFGFNKLADACQFVETCMECSDEGTIVSIRENKED